MKLIVKRNPAHNFIRTLTLLAALFLAGCKSQPSTVPESIAEPVATSVVETVPVSEDSVSDNTSIDQDTEPVAKEQPPRPQAPKEVHGVWISYHEWQDMPKSEEAFDEYVTFVMANLKRFGLNTIYLHVRADADAMYESKYFPWSSYITGTQGLNPGYDPLSKFVTAAHENGIRIHAWINPYRVAHKDCPPETLSKDNPAVIWLNDDNPDNDRWVLRHDGDLYFNPSIPEVRELILAGVMEIIENYDVDGIHLDDYFYPTLDDKDPSRSFDLKEYYSYNLGESVTDWRRENVNILIKNMYEMIKEYDSTLELGISPAGNIDNLYSDKQYFSDVALWMREDGYIDYIVPQLYWGFEIKKKDGTLAPYAYENNLNRWISLLENENVKLYPGLPMYIAGTDVFDRNDVSEWLCYDDVIKRQVLYGRETGRVDGYVIYSFASFFKEEAAKEVKNLTEIFKEEDN